MKKSIFLLMIAIACTHSEKSTLSGEEIFEKYLGTMANKDKARDIKTLTYTYHVSDKYGVKTGSIISKYPDKYYYEIIFPDSNKYTYLVNGDTGIFKTPQEVKSMPEELLYMYKLNGLIFPDLHYQRLGFQFKLSGEETINDHACYKLEIKGEHQPFYYYIDKKSFKCIRTLSHNIITEITDTVNINGICLPKSYINMNTLDTSATMHWNIDNYILDDYIADSIFRID